MTQPFGDRFKHWRAWFPLSVIVVVTLAASVNRQLVGLIAQPVKVELGLSDTQLGGLWSLSGVLVACVSPVVGQMVDRFDRHKVLLGSILIWSIATAAYGLAAGYIALGISLAVLAAAETTLVPACNSLIAERFRGEARINANLVYFAAGGLTTGVGTFVGATLLHWSTAHLHSLTPYWQTATEWRVALVFTALAGVPLALMALVLGRDVRKPSTRSAADLSDLKLYLRDHWRTLVSFNLSNAGYFIAATTVMGWVPVYIVRHYGIAPADLGTRLGMVIGVADVLGIVVGFIAIKKLYHHLGSIAPRYIFQASLCGIAMLNLLQLAMTTVWSVLIVLGVQNFLATFGTASFNNMVQDMSAPDIRGKIFGINSVIVSLASIPGPLIVGMLSDHFQHEPHGLLWATVMVSTPALFGSVLLYGLTNRSFLTTVHEMRRVEAIAA